MPNRGLGSAGQRFGRAGRFGNTKGRKCSTRGYNLLCPERCNPEGVLADSEHQGSKGPSHGLQSTSPRIGHFIERVDRLGNANGRHSSPQIGHFCGAFRWIRKLRGSKVLIRRLRSTSPRIDSETPGVEGPQRRATIRVTHNRAFRRAHR